MMADFIGVDVPEDELVRMSAFLSQQRYQSVHAFQEGVGLRTRAEQEQALGVTEENTAQPAFSAELPMAFDGSMDLELRVPGRHLWGQDNGFLRLDIYPRVRPIVHERHFGFWDIPLTAICQEKTKARLDLKQGTLSLQGAEGENAWRPVPGLRIPFHELGNVVMHLSRWESVQGSPRMAQVQSYPVLLDSGDPGGIGPDSPMKQIHIPVTDACNLNCPMCPRSSERYSVAGHMAAGVFEALLEEVPKVSCVMVMALGEPLMYPAVVEVVRRCRERLPKAGEVGMTTNATLLDESMALQLIDAGLGFLYASVDGATQATYERYRTGATFEATCSNLKRFTKLVREQGSSCRTMLNFVMMEGNVHEIPAFVKLAAELAAGNVTFSYEHGRHSDELNTFGDARLQNLLTEACRLGAALGINVGIPPVRRALIGRCFCTERVLTSPDGGVYPCPMLQPGYHAEGMVMRFGNVLERPLRDIWDSEPYRAFRRGVLSGRFPEACANCGFKAYLTA
jgi:radical SAM protein with 4Fe4S-binding SPASM domain